jgi:hypothetical protein
MDKVTVDYYPQNVRTVAQRYESVVSSLSKSFGEAFKPRSRLLYVGCGSGLDLALFASLGCEQNQLSRLDNSVSRIGDTVP